MLKSVVGCIWYILILFDGTVNKKKQQHPTEGAEQKEITGKLNHRSNK